MFSAKLDKLFYLCGVGFAAASPRNNLAQLAQP